MAALAFLVQRTLERKLKDAGSDLSPAQALGALRTIRVVDLDLGNGESKRSVTRGSTRCAQILQALKLTDLDPPTPPAEDSEAL